MAPEGTLAFGLYLDGIRPNRVERQYEDRGPTAQSPGGSDSYRSDCWAIRKPGSVADESDNDER